MSRTTKIRQREIGINYFILVKFSNIRKLHLDDKDGGPCE
jgi:hypothetical protein